VRKYFNIPILHSAKMAKKFKCEIRSWNNIHKLSRKVADKIKESDWRPDLIIGLARGGWVPSRSLCDFLAVKDLISLKVEHWGVTATPDGKAVLKYPFEFDLKGKKVLIVDDITDTGESMVMAKKYIEDLGPSEVKTATLMHITCSKFKADYVAEIFDHVNNWTWVVFPWNFTEDMCHLISSILENGEKMHLDAVQRGLEGHYQIKVDKEELHDIMMEMKRREEVEEIEEEVLHWRKKNA